MQKPVLVLQMQRMGDLILSFPLLGLLQNIYPDRPIWTVAEEVFFSKLMPLAPKTTFFPPSAAAQLRTQAYHTVINLSHREDAMHLAGSVEAEKRYGAYTQNTTTYIHGKWSLYRASIVNNNRYNLFHWSDLYLLDHLGSKKMPPWSFRTSSTPHENTIGIFVGASEKEKHPSAEFFAKLAKNLTRKGYKTLFLGGPQDIPMGQEAEQLSGLKGASLCGKFSIEQLALVLQNLALFITPDTGPMHLASWVNTPILNISLGPVNPWETGPRCSQNPREGLQHHIIQPALSCVGCWQACTGISRCHKKLRAENVALIAHMLLQKQPLASKEFSDMHVYRAGYDTQGFYDLNPCLQSQEKSSARLLLARFWQKWFYLRLQDQRLMQDYPIEQFSHFCTHYPVLGQHMRHNILLLGKKLREQLKSTVRHKKHTADADFWKEIPQVLRPLSSYMQFYLQNNEYSLAAWEYILHDMEALYKTTS